MPELAALRNPDVWNFFIDLLFAFLYLSVAGAIVLLMFAFIVAALCIRLFSGCFRWLKKIF